MDDDGEIKKGPKGLKGSPSLGDEMSPKRNDYDFEEGDMINDFIHKNVDKLRPLYDEGGGEAIDGEFNKYRLLNSTKDIHPISKDEADGIMYDNVKQSWYDGWFRNADSSYKPILLDQMLKSPEVRNAGLSLAYENYKNVCKYQGKEPLDFEKFLVTPVSLYRGDKGRKRTKDDVFDAYTFDKSTAKWFAGDRGEVIEKKVRPIDTYGSMRAVGEAEIWIPKEMSPEKRMDSKEDGGWEWYDPIKFAFYEVDDERKQIQSSTLDLLDSVIQEADMIKLFSEGDSDVKGKMIERCVDSLQKYVKQITALNKRINEDGVFFAEELNDNIGERNILYPEVASFRERRQKRLAKDRCESGVF